MQRATNERTAQAGKVWFITGAGRGIGAEIAKAALLAGDRVVATGRNVEQLKTAYASHGDQVLCLALDVSQELDATAAVETAAARFGRIDVLVNNAGYGQLGLFEEVASGDVERQFATNVFGLMHVTRAALPLMRRQRSGHILNLASIGGFMGFESSSIYCAAKFAVEGFSESLALELARFDIKVTVVEPGFFRTDFLDRSSVRYGARIVADYPRADYESYNHRQPGDPAKLGRAIVQVAAMAEPPLHFLAGSDAVQYATQAFERRRAEVGSYASLSVTTDIDHSPYVGMWVTQDGSIRHELRADGRYDEARGKVKSAYQGRYRMTGDHIDYVDDTGFTADGDFRDGILYHAGMVLYRER